MIRAALVVSLLSRAHAAGFPSCQCDQYTNGLTSDKVGSQACGKYENNVLSCMDPVRPYVYHMDSGCPSGT